MSNGLRLRCEIRGLEGLFRSLAQVQRASTRNAVQRTAITKAVRLVRKQARALAPRYRGKYLVPGLLKRSMDFVVRTYPERGLVLGVVGPKKGHKVQAGTRTRGKRAGQPYYQDPVKYAHLVERGTKRSRRYDFMRNAWDQTKDQARELIEKELAAGIFKALVKQAQTRKR